MRAAVNRRYGPAGVVRIEEIEKPAPGRGEVLVRIHATSVNSADSRLRRMDVPRGFGVPLRLAFGIFAPRNRVLGMEFSGTVEALGSGVTKFRVGDAVFATCLFRAHAEYRVISQDAAIALKPEKLSFEQAGAMGFGGVTALSYLKGPGNVAEGDRVLINGASGAVGVAAIQLAKHFGARVTAVCSARNADLVLSLGADEVIDYARVDFAATGETYDIIMDNVGNASWRRCKGALAPDGRLLMVVAGLADMLVAAVVSLRKGKRAIALRPDDRAEDLLVLADLARAGKFAPFIERVHEFEDIGAAHAHVDSGRKRGSVVVRVGGLPE